jgi:hypothetical protein
MYSDEEKRTERKKVKQRMHCHRDRTGNHHVRVIHVCVAARPVQCNDMKDEHRNVHVTECRLYSVNIIEHNKQRNQSEACKNPEMTWRKSKPKHYAGENAKGNLSDILIAWLLE